MIGTNQYVLMYYFYNNAWHYIYNTISFTNPNLHTKIASSNSTALTYTLTYLIDSSAINPNFKFFFTTSQASNVFNTMSPGTFTISFDYTYYV
jgi:hypothetical protein